MASFSQQETNRKILEDLQQKKQLLQKGVPVATNIAASIGEMASVAAATRSAFNPTNSTSFGYFVQQDSHYGNTFIPVLPRLDPPAVVHPPK